MAADRTGLIREAERCERLSRGSSDSDLCATLMAWADEYRRAARSLPPRGRRG